MWEGSLNISRVMAVLGCIGRVLKYQPWDGWVGRDVGSGTEGPLSVFVADTELQP